MVDIVVIKKQLSEIRNKLDSKEYKKAYPLYVDEFKNVKSFEEILKEFSTHLKNNVFLSKSQQCSMYLSLVGIEIAIDMMLEGLPIDASIKSIVKVKQTGFNFNRFTSKFKETVDYIEFYISGNDDERENKILKNLTKLFNEQIDILESYQIPKSRRVKKKRNEIKDVSWALN